MPVYEYECEGCQRTFERLVRSSREERNVTCPECGARNVERKFSVFAPRSAAPAAKLPVGGCARCGDPNGPCAMND